MPVEGRRLPRPACKRDGESVRRSGEEERSRRQSYLGARSLPQGRRRGSGPAPLRAAPSASTAGKGAARARLTSPSAATAHAPAGPAPRPPGRSAAPPAALRMRRAQGGARPPASRGRWRGGAWDAQAQECACASQASPLHLPPGNEHAQAGCTLRTAHAQDRGGAGPRWGEAPRHHTSAERRGGRQGRALKGQYRVGVGSPHALVIPLDAASSSRGSGGKLSKASLLPSRAQINVRRWASVGFCMAPASVLVRASGSR